MADEDLSLLFKLRADNVQAKAAIAETRAAVASLKQSLGTDLNQGVTVANKSFAELGDRLNDFVGERLPLVGGAVVKITGELHTLTEELKSGGPQTAKLADQIEGIAKASGKTAPEISRFLSTFVRLEGQTARNDAAFKFFGGSVDVIGNKTAKFIPELESAGSSMAALATEAGSAGAAVASMAGPIGIAVIAVAALAAVAVSAARELFELTKRAAEAQGKMYDLAQQTGLSVKTLSALEVAAKTTGGEIGSVTQAVVIFQQKLDDAQDPLSTTAEKFRILGVDTSDTETSLRSAFAALAKMPEGFAQTNAAAELFGGRGGKQVLAILKETNGDLDATIKRLESLGILISEDDARAADILNDELVLLDLQMQDLEARLARDLIPAFVQLAKESEGLIRAVKPLVSLFGTLAGSTTEFLTSQFNALRLAITAITKDYVEFARAIRDVAEASSTEIQPIKVPAITPVQLPGAATPLQISNEAVTSAEAVLAEVKRKAAQTNQALDESFQKGRVDRQNQTLDIIASNKQVLEADKARIDALLTQKEREIQALDEAAKKRGEIVNRETDQYRAINKEVAKLQQERLDKENEFEVTSRALRAKAAQERAQSLRGQLQNEGDILVKEFDRTIKDIEAAIKRGSQEEEAGLRTIDQLEHEKLDAQLETLQKQKDIGFLTVQERKDLDAQLQKLQQDKDRLDDDQRNRRLQREAEAAARNREILIANLEALIQLEQIAGERRIDSIKSLAAARIIAEEDAAKQILQIRLGLIDDEIAATEAKLTASKSIADKDERIRVQTELNNQIKILTEQRKTIQVEGNREIEEKRQEDLDNERQYADDLAEIKRRTQDIERDAAEEVIRLMVLHFARRKDIIRAQRDLDLADEAARHQRIRDSISAQQREVDEQIRVIERHLEGLKIGTTEEIEQYERLIRELEKLRIKRGELKAQQDAEKSRSDTRQRGITDKSNADLERENPLSTRSLFGDSFAEILERIKQAAIDAGEPISNLRANFEALAQSAADAFAQMSKDTGNFASFASEAFGTLAQGLGQIVESYVLLGTTGPAVLRKLLAQILAHLAAEAAVKAIFELAEGFALLFVDPLAAGAHFQAAALYGSVAGVAAVAGRAVAGDLFKPQTSGTGTRTGAGGSTGSQRSGSTQPQPVNLDRPTQAPPINMSMTVTVIRDAGSIVDVVVDDAHHGGKIRDMMVKEITR
jgi:hypothetical protein